MDPTAPRLEKIRTALALMECTTQIYVRVYVALIVVALTAALALVGAAPASQVSWVAAMVMVAHLMAAMLFVALRILALSATLVSAYTTANDRIDTSMASEGEIEDDGPQADEGGT